MKTPSWHLHGEAVENYKNLYQDSWYSDQEPKCSSPDTSSKHYCLGQLVCYFCTENSSCPFICYFQHLQLLLGVLPVFVHAISNMNKQMLWKIRFKAYKLLSHMRCITLDQWTYEWQLHVKQKICSIPRQHNIHTQTCITFQQLSVAENKKTMKVKLQLHINANPLKLKMTSVFWIILKRIKESLQLST
jgi:hypothetical protein